MPASAEQKTPLMPSPAKHSFLPHLLSLALLGSASGALAQATLATPASSAPLPSMTAKDARAEAIWQFRAGLNVAALQCQFSPYLRTVANYNAFLRQHSDELAASFKGMTDYFVRTRGKAGQRAFDSYATRTNQSFATFDAQYSFCDAAAMLGRKALAVPKGKFGDFAVAELPALRASLVTPEQSIELKPRLEWAVVPTLKDPCPGRPGCKR